MFWNPLTGHLSSGHAHAYRYCLLVILLMLLGGNDLLAQPTNDSCAVARFIPLPTEYNTPQTYNGHNIGATPEIPASFIANCTPGGIFSGLGADVWYTFSPTENTCINFQVDGLQAPEISIREGDFCYDTNEIDCVSSTNGTVNTTVTLLANTLYYLRISGANYNDQGYFQLSLNRVSCPTEDPCLRVDHLEVSPPPDVLDFQGQEILYYPPGTSVYFCYTIEQWNSVNNNWLHSVEIEFGEAWDLTTLIPFVPESCNSNGEWDWYNDWLSCNTGDEFGPGFAYDASNGLRCDATPYDGLPGNNWGDGSFFCGIDFCWQISVKSCEQISDEMISTDLDVSITALADSQSGSYLSLRCDQNPDEVLELQTSCGSGGGGNCLPQIAMIETTNVSCYDASDGSFTIEGEDAGLNSNVLIYDLNDVLLEAYLDVSLPFTLPAILDTGFYGIILETPGINEQGFCPGYLLGIINIRGPFETITRIAEGDLCQQDSIQLNGIIWPATNEEVSYLWSGPNEFFSNEASPTVTEPGEYILTIIKDGCRISDTLQVEFRTSLSLQINSPNGIPCVSDELILTAGGAGAMSTNYEWIIPTASNLQTPTFNTIDFTWEFGPIVEDADLLLVGFDELGCSDTIPYSVQVAEIPDIELEIGLENCSAESVMASVLDNPLINKITWLDDNSNFSTRIFSGLAPGEVFDVSVEILYNNFACTLIEQVSIVGPGLTLEVSDTSICGSMVSLSASPAESYLWSTGATSASIEVLPPLDESTEYSVTVTDSYGCVHTDAATIQSFSGVSADFTYTGEDFTLQFTPLAPENTNNFYYWYFGDGDISNDYAPQHTYASSGDYQVILDVENACGVEEYVLTVSIQFPPLAAFTTDDVAQGCAPLEVTFLNQSTNGEAYLWTFPGGIPASSTALNPTVTYLDAGIYPVQLNVTNSVGEDLVIAENYIEVFAGPSGSFSSVTNELTAQFTSSTSNVDTYLWEFGDGNTSSEPNPLHTYSANGTYPVSLSITNDCGTEVITQEISIQQAAPEAVFATVAPAMGCAPLTVTYLNQSLNADAYAWTFPGGVPATSTLPNPTVTYLNAGVYDVTLVATNQTGSSTAEAQSFVEVFPTPAGSFTYTSDLLTAQFSSSTTNTDSYLWDFGDGTISTEPNPTHVYNLSGTYTVSLSITNECGTVVITEEVGVMRPIPQVSFTTEDLQQGCAPLTVNFINQSANANSYLWVFSGGSPGSSTEENPTITYSTPGVYDVQLNATNETGTNTLVAQFYIEVDPEPSGSFSYLSELLEVQFFSEVENTDSYLWNFGDGTTSTAANPSHTYETGGTYTVTLELTNECGTTTLTQELDVMRPLPTVAFTTDGAAQGCAPFSVTFLNQTTNAVSYLWSFPGADPTTSTEEHPTVVYNTPGTYAVELTATNESGNSFLTQANFIEVISLPFGNFVAESDLLTVVFTSSITNADSYTWLFGDGSSSLEENPVHTYLKDGVYVVTLTVENECGTVNISNTINVMTTNLDDIGLQAAWRLYPNPTRNNLWLEVTDWPAVTEGNVTIFNALGEQMSQQNISLPSGNYRTPLSLNLPAGVYWLRLETDTFGGGMKKVVVQ
jgi:PKD repeat protein